jgi:hypothetical protein
MMPLLVSLIGFAWTSAAHHQNGCENGKPRSIAKPALAVTVGSRNSVRSVLSLTASPHHHGLAVRFF